MFRKGIGIVCGVAALVCLLPPTVGTVGTKGLWINAFIPVSTGGSYLHVFTYRHWLYIVYTGSRCRECGYQVLDNDHSPTCSFYKPPARPVRDVLSDQYPDDWLVHFKPVRQKKFALPGVKLSNRLAGGRRELSAMVSCFILTSLFGISSAWLVLPPVLRNRVRRSRVEGGQCAACGYDLTGNSSGICPECGEATEIDNS
jgi:hypothetical protein